MFHKKGGTLWENKKIRKKVLHFGKVLQFGVMHCIKPKWRYLGIETTCFFYFTGRIFWPKKMYKRCKKMGQFNRKFHSKFTHYLCYNSFSSGVSKFCDILTVRTYQDYKPRLQIFHHAFWIIQSADIRKVKNVMLKFYVPMADLFW